MTNLSEKAQKLLSRKPTHIQTLMGYKFYEHPDLGEDTFMLCITPCGNVYTSCFMELLDKDDLDYQISVWRETKKTFKG